MELNMSQWRAKVVRPIVEAVRNEQCCCFSFLDFSLNGEGTVRWIGHQPFHFSVKCHLYPGIYTISFGRLHELVTLFDGFLFDMPISTSIFIRRFPEGTLNWHGSNSHSFLWFNLSKINSLVWKQGLCCTRFKIDYVIMRIFGIELSFFLQKRP